MGVRVAGCGLRVAGCALQVEGMKMTSYKDLDIYQLSYDAAVMIHKMSLTLPSYELYEEGSQIRKSSKGVTSCIVEGIEENDINQTS